MNSLPETWIGNPKQNESENPKVNPKEQNETCEKTGLILANKFRIKFIVASYVVYGKPLQKPPNKSRGYLYWSIVFDVIKIASAIMSNLGQFFSPQDCTTLCEGDTMEHYFPSCQDDC